MQASKRISQYFEVAGRRNMAAILLLGLLVIAAYSNTFLAAWHMDDYPNILHNPAVQMQTLDPVSLERAVGISRSQGNNLPRPVVNLTFALNWWLHGDNVAGYHLVNIAIHFINALFLFLIVRLLNARPLLADAIRGRSITVALVAALFWALNPIQTQAVTYVVQRYASLSTLFFLAALISYIRGRMTPERWRACLWWAAALAAFLLSLGSKENAALWPASVLLVEWIFFRKCDGQPSAYLRKLAVAAALLFITFVGGLLAVFEIDVVKAVLHGFDGRPFTLTERMMTQPRVIVYYLSQLFYPIPQRLSLEHDFTVSTSLLQPWTTLPAILAVVMLVILGLKTAHKRPVLAFAILFFLLNHLVESTLLPLEMVFEHRNYLPSLFLFWPLAIGGLRLWEQLRRRKSPLHRLIPAAAVSLLLFFTLGTFSRNMDWRTEHSLWNDAFRKAPRSARAAVNLANDLARNGHFDAAADLYERATTLRSPKINQFKVVARSNLATMYQKMGTHEKALDQWLQVLDIVPHNRPARLGLANLHLMMGNYDQAELQIDWLVQRHPREIRFLDSKAFLLIRQNRPEDALVVLRRALAEKPDHGDILVKIGVVQAMLGYHERADWFFRRALQTAPHDLGIQLVRLENSLAAGRAPFAEMLGDSLLDRYPLEAIWERLSAPGIAILNPKGLRQDLRRQLLQKAAELGAVDTKS